MLVRAPRDASAVDAKHRVGHHLIVQHGRTLLVGQAYGGPVVNFLLLLLVGAGVDEVRAVAPFQTLMPLVVKRGDSGNRWVGALPLELRLGSAHVILVGPRLHGGHLDLPVVGNGLVRVRVGGGGRHRGFG